MNLGPGAAADLLREARRLDEARAYPELAERLAPWDPAALGVEPELLFLRADVARRLGRPAEASADLEALDERIGRYGNVSLQRRQLNLRGSLQFESGRIDLARDTWLRQLHDATAAGDEEFAARACNNLGVVATLLDDLPAALAYYGRAVSAYLQIGYLRGLGQAHHNLGITYREMGFLHDADTHFRSADRFAARAESPDEVARVAQERALLLFLLGDPEMARHSAEQALRTYRMLEDPAGAAEVLRVQGLIALGEGDLIGAEQALASSLGTARELSPLLEAELLAARSALRARQGRSDEARTDADRATELFARLGAPGWGRRAMDRARAVAARGGARLPRPGEADPGSLR